ncbi:MULTISPECIES: peptide-methionine (S)-S-oxide reductase MsrA [Sphingobacterium]|uniref:Peptide methionine sulfoxide reductase MsrA n=1 Tax=Sphingobacterium populi TaxID=1812824 RepID=A0ABW5UA39_9SPHI|nr:peptide-methionine (S)-S-oxide reductase MsrA [Sphingobacterium sp. CFCC 11742]
MNNKIMYLFALCTLVLASCQATSNTSKPVSLATLPVSDDRQEAIMAAGCFWCIETSLGLLEGVDTVISGYIGGKGANPTYEQVTTGQTGYAEAVKITYDPKIISYDELLKAFFQLHDPTQLNRQGNDVGTQYRSALFPLNAEQEEKAAYYIAQLNAEKVYDKPIVTTIEKSDVFYPAEDYHQDYFNKNPSNSYCQFVVQPKLEKFKKVFEDKLK